VSLKILDLALGLLKAETVILLDGEFIVAEKVLLEFVIFCLTAAFPFGDKTWYRLGLVLFVPISEGNVEVDATNYEEVLMKFYESP
jgi:hypothetical protein